MIYFFFLVFSIFVNITVGAFGVFAKLAHCPARRCGREDWPSMRWKVNPFRSSWCWIKSSILVQVLNTKLLGHVTLIISLTFKVVLRCLPLLTRILFLAKIMYQFLNFGRRSDERSREWREKALCFANGLFWTLWTGWTFVFFILLAWSNTR